MTEIKNFIIIMRYCHLPKKPICESHDVTNVRKGLPQQLLFYSVAFYLIKHHFLAVEKKITDKDANVFIL